MRLSKWSRASDCVDGLTSFLASMLEGFPDY